MDNRFELVILPVYEEMISDIRGGSPFFVDKMPYNFMYVPLIKLSLPKSRIVLCERNPLDNCLSIYKQKFGVGNAYAYSLEELGNYYNSYREITNQWKSLLGDQIFCLNYEGLIRNQPKSTHVHKNQQLIQNNKNKYTNN